MLIPNNRLNLELFFVGISGICGKSFQLISKTLDETRIRCMAKHNSVFFNINPVMHERGPDAINICQPCHL